MACIFCNKVIRNPESLTVYRDDKVIIFLDKFPRTKGHVCVAPVQHYSAPLDAPTDVSKRVMAEVVDVCAVLRMYGAEGINIGANIGPIAGQQVPHFHVHVIPRYEADDAVEIEPAFVNTPWRQKSLDLSDKEFRQICTELAKLMREHKGLL